MASQSSNEHSLALGTVLVRIDLYILGMRGGTISKLGPIQTKSQAKLMCISRPPLSTVHFFKSGMRRVTLLLVFQAPDVLSRLQPRAYSA